LDVTVAVPVAACATLVRMQVPEAATIERENLDSGVGEVPNADAVFVVWAGDRSAYLAKTSMLQRRLLRIFKPTDAPKRSLNLREVATRVEYWPTASRFESMLLHYALARRYFPDDYLRLVKLRMPAYVKLILANEFPRTLVSSRLSASRALHYGPFQSRAAAELFEDQFLDLFQIRRCQENLEPSPQHPGCIYGEMNRCLRPCQQVVSREEYLSEAGRVEEFLAGNGTALISVASAARDRLSGEMNFEEAARQHKRLERIQAVLALRGDLVCDIDRLYGVAVAPSSRADSVQLWFVCQGAWQAPVELPLTSLVSLDQRLRELVGAIQPVTPPLSEKQEHLALLARWHYSTWSDGEWIGFPGLDQAPYRKLVRAISRVRQKSATRGSRADEGVRPTSETGLS
jgi:excinuclease ABC subunit C